MKKLASTLPNMFLSLTLICMVAAAALASINNLTSEPIKQAKTAKLEQAIREVTPEFDNNPTMDKLIGVSDTGDSLTIYPAKKGGEFVGAAVEGFTNNGFNGRIKVLVGFDKEGKILNYSVLEHAETPGLGSKMQEWFRQDKNNQSILGLQVPEKGLVVSKDGGTVDAITAATISSRAFLGVINSAFSAFKQSGVNTNNEAATVEEGGQNE